MQCAPSETQLEAVEYIQIGDHQNFKKSAPQLIGASYAFWPFLRVLLCWWIELTFIIFQAVIKFRKEKKNLGEAQLCSKANLSFFHIPGYFWGCLSGPCVVSG